MSDKALEQVAQRSDEVTSLEVLKKSVDMTLWETFLWA